MSGMLLAWRKCFAAKRREYGVPEAAEVIPPAHDDEASHERGTQCRYPRKRSCAVEKIRIAAIGTQDHKK